MAKANDIDFAQMSMGEIDELEKKLAELKKQKMKEDKAEVVKKVRKLCKDYGISATQLPNLFYHCCFLFLHPLLL